MNDSQMNETDLNEIEQQLARCVDGELSEEEQLQLLHLLETQPNGVELWKKLSLSFIENQVLNSFFSEADLFAEHDTELELPSGNASIAEDTVVEGSTEKPRSEPKRSFLDRRYHPLTSLACSLVLGLSIGFGIDHFRSPSSLDQIADNNIVPQKESTSLPQPVENQGLHSPPQNRTQNEFNRLASAPSLEEVENTLPRYQYADVDQTQSHFGLPDASLNWLRDQGYVVDSIPDSREIHIGNGQKMEVPSNTILIRHAVH